MTRKNENKSERSEREISQQIVVENRWPFKYFNIHCFFFSVTSKIINLECDKNMRKIKEYL